MRGRGENWPIPVMKRGNPLGSETYYPAGASMGWGGHQIFPIGEELRLRQKRREECGGHAQRQEKFIASLRDVAWTAAAGLDTTFVFSTASCLQLRLAQLMGKRLLRHYEKTCPFVYLASAIASVWRLITRVLFFGSSFLALCRQSTVRKPRYQRTRSGGLPALLSAWSVGPDRYG